MLETDRLGQPRNSIVRAADRSPRSHGQRFALGGIAFELLASGQARTGLALEPDAERYAVPSDRHPVIADVLCSVAIDDALFEGASPYGALELADGAFQALEHGEIELRAPRVQATLCRIGRDRYACSARIASDPRALTALLRSVIAVVVHAAGGVVLQAAGVVLDQRAVLYVGASGVGKSTAASLTESARMFASDHVALLPVAGAVLAYGLPGGTAAPMVSTEQVVWPLGAVLRVERADTAAPQLHTLHETEAACVLREAVVAVDGSPLAERDRQRAVGSIASASAVGTLHTVLGAPVGRLVRGALPPRVLEIRA